MNDVDDERLLSSMTLADRSWPVYVLQRASADVCSRCITAAQGSVATVRFGSKGHSGATYQVLILEHSAQRF